MAMATHSYKTYPSSPSKVGTLPSLLSFRYSGVGLVVSISTMSSWRSLAFATARIAVLRGLFCEEISQHEFDSGLSRHWQEGLTSYVYSLPKAIVANLSSFHNYQVGG